MKRLLPRRTTSPARRLQGTCGRNTGHSLSERNPGLAQMSALKGTGDGSPAKTPEDDAQAFRATGMADSHPRPYSQQLAGESVRSSARSCHEQTLSKDARDVRNPMQSAGLRTDMRRDATTCDKATERTRTVDLRFTKPLLCQLSYGGARRKYNEGNCLRNRIT